MKKLILLLLFIPFCVNATINDYYMEAEVLKNGDVSVREVFSLNGSYNGFDREIFLNDNIYSGTDVEIVKVKGIDNGGKNSFDTLNLLGDEFELVGSASVGDYGYYTIDNTDSGVSVRIFNPSSRDKAFYVEYIIKRMAIKHKDVGELGYNIFTSLNEDLYNLNARFLLPNNKSVRAWGHGSLNGLVTIESPSSVLVTLDYLYAYEPVDVRILFDRSFLDDNAKSVADVVLDEIIREETDKADEANKIREEERDRLETYKRIALQRVEKFEKTRLQVDKNTAYEAINLIYGEKEYYEYRERLDSLLSIEEEQYEKNQRISSKVVNVFCAVYIALVCYLIYEFYKKYDKEYKGEFDGQYYRDFPASYGPEIVEFLFSNNVTANGFSASILNLIYKKNIGFKELKSTGLFKNKNYQLNLLSRDNITSAEERLLNCVFAHSTTISLKKLKAYAKSSYSEFLCDYNCWASEVRRLSDKEKFYEKNSRLVYILIAISGFVFAFIGINFEYVNYYLIFGSIAISFGSLIYFLSARKKTIKGNNDYSKWLGLKNFMTDFGRMHEKELPEIALWEKYLVYATVFGCAKKLAKDMQIKVSEMQDVEVYRNHDFSRMNSIIDMPNLINTTINDVKQTASNAYSAAHSTNSSGGGFGGGFSGGGGSFGGGGGGGRF